MEDHVAPGRQRPRRALAEAAGQRLHRQVVGHQQAVEADLLADQPHHRAPTGSPAPRGRARRRRRARSSPSAGRPAPGTARNPPRAPPPGRHPRQVEVAVERRRGRARACASSPAARRRRAALGHGAADRGHLGRIVAVGAVADDRVGLGPRRRRAPARSSTSMPTAAQLRGDQPVAQRASPAPAARGRAAGGTRRAPAATRATPARAAARRGRPPGRSGPARRGRPRRAARRSAARAGPGPRRCGRTG